MYDIVIAGGGAAGLSAALYAGRAKLKALVIEKYNITGSQIITLEFLLFQVLSL